MPGRVHPFLVNPAAEVPTATFSSITLKCAPACAARPLRVRLAAVTVRNRPFLRHALAMLQRRGGQRRIPLQSPHAGLRPRLVGQRKNLLGTPLADRRPDCPGDPCASAAAQLRTRLSLPPKPAIKPVSQTLMLV